MSNFTWVANFYEYFEDAEILEDTVVPILSESRNLGEGIKYKYFDIYCKNYDCDCTEIVLHIYREDKYLGDARYDYKQQRLTTEYNHLINLDTLIEESELFEIKHQYHTTTHFIEPQKKQRNTKGYFIGNQLITKNICDFPRGFGTGCGSNFNFV